MTGPFSLTDEQAMWRVRHADDHAAFASLVERWETPIQRLCARMTGDLHRAEDLAQEAFARVFAKRHAYEPSGKFSTWLWRIALNLCHDDIRRRQRRPEWSLEETVDGEGEVSPAAERVGEAPSPAEAVAALEQAEIVRRALLLALATVTGPLVAQRAAAADKPRAVRATSPQPAEAPEPPEAPALPGAVEDVTVNIAGIEPSVRDGLRQAQIQVTRASRDMQRQFAQMQMGFNGSANTRTLLVPADDASPEQLGRLREELAIMSRIFGKAAAPDGGKRSGFRFNFGGLDLGQNRELDALYLDGYGAVFPLDVDFPLIDAPKVAEKKAEPKSDKDATWEKTRRELAGGPEEEADEVDEDAGESNSAPFEADKVAALRKRLIESFRHAANLKSVKPEEQVVLVVSSPASRSGGHHSGSAKIVRVTGISSSSSGGGSGAGSGRKMLSFGGPENHGGPARQQLTLRAKKSDVEAFAAGKLKADEFAKKVRVASREESAAAKP